MTEFSSGGESTEKLTDIRVRRLLVYLRLDSLPSVFALIALLGADSKSPIVKQATEKDEITEKDVEAQSFTPAKPPLEVHGLRMLVLTERASSVMQLAKGDDYNTLGDPVVDVFRVFSQLNGLSVTGKVAVVPTSSYAETLTSQASDMSSDFVLVPWSEHGGLVENQSASFAVSAQDRYQGKVYIEFVQETLKLAVCNTGIFINNGFGGLGASGLEKDPQQLRKDVSGASTRKRSKSTASSPFKDKTRKHQIFLPFFGGVDDRASLRFVIQLAKNPNVTATIARFDWPQEDYDDVSFPPEVVMVVPSSSHASSSKARRPSKRTGGSILEQVSTMDLALLSTLQSTLPPDLAGRVKFVEISVTSANVAAESIAAAREAVSTLSNNAGDIIVVGRRHARLGDLPIDAGGPDLKTTVGAVAEQMVTSGIKASVLVIQAGGRGYDM
jgi:hypothetical protein